MASPQTENGHTKIANELLEQLVKAGLLGSELSIALFIIRKTYGYQKKQDIISLTQFEKGTNLSRMTVVKSLKNLIAKGIVVKTAILAYKLEKDYEKWVVNTALLVKHNDPASKDRFTKIGIHGYTHKRKKEITKEINPHLAMPSDEVNQLFSLFYETINPNINYAHQGNRNDAKWLIDKYGLEKVMNAAKFAISVQGKPYAPTINTPSQLKNRMADLIAYQQKEQAKLTSQKKGLVL